jgi:hypothetical protein
MERRNFLQAAIGAVAAGLSWAFTPAAEVAPDLAGVATAAVEGAAEGALTHANTLPPGVDCGSITIEVDRFDKEGNRFCDLSWAATGRIRSEDLADVAAYMAGRLPRRRDGWHREITGYGVTGQIAPGKFVTHIHASYREREVR